MKIGYQHRARSKREYGPPLRVSDFIRSEGDCMIPMPRRGHSERDCTMSKWKFPQYATMTFSAMLLLAGCVSEQKYDALDTEYQQLN